MTSKISSNHNEIYNEELIEGLPKILLSVYSNDEILYQKYFPNTVTFGDLIIDFEENIKDPQIKNKIEYNFKNKKINKKDKILNMNKVEKNVKIIEIDISLEFTELSFPKEKKKLFQNKILKPEINPLFHIISYSPKESTINLETYSEKDIIENSLNEFSTSSAYCNSNDALYLSGGEINGKETNNFWKIDHTKKNIQHCEMPICKSNHSMLFIPDKYILIAGGKNKDCLIYDIEKKIFIKWGNLNDIYLEPTLILDDDNCVYCLNKFEGGKKSFEKSDLKNFPYWAKINPKVISNPFDLKLFSAVKNSDNNFILFGGNELGKNKKCFLYDVKKNELKNIDIPNEIIQMSDKNFYPINNYISVNIPNDFNENKELILLNNLNQTIKKIPFDISEEEKVMQDEIHFKCPNNIGIGTFGIKTKIKLIPEIEDNKFSDDDEEIEEKKPENRVLKNAKKLIFGKRFKKALDKLRKNNNMEEKINEEKEEKIEEIKNEEIPKKNNKFLDLANEKLKNLSQKDNNWNRLVTKEKKIKKSLDREKLNKDLVILSIPQLNKEQTNLDLPSLEEENLESKNEEPIIEKIETLKDEINENEKKPELIEPIKFQSINRKLKIPLSEYSYNKERNILDKEVIHLNVNKNKDSLLEIPKEKIQEKTEETDLNKQKKSKDKNDNISNINITGKFPGVVIPNKESIEIKGTIPGISTSKENVNKPEINNQDKIEVKETEIIENKNNKKNEKVHHIEIKEVIEKEGEEEEEEEEIETITTITTRKLKSSKKP